MIEIATFVDEGLGHSSYLVDLGDGHALVVDPPRLPHRHLADAQARRTEITLTADTHSHADYVSGSPELAARGARRSSHRPTRGSRFTITDSRPATNSSCGQASCSARSRLPVTHPTTSRTS